MYTGVKMLYIVLLLLPKVLSSLTIHDLIALLMVFVLLWLQKKVDPSLLVEVKPSIRQRKVQEEKMRRQSAKEEYWRRRDAEERWREEMRYMCVCGGEMVVVGVLAVPSRVCGILLGMMFSKLLREKDLVTPRVYAYSE